MLQPAVLIVEDEPITRSTLRTRLTILGANVVEAEDGAAALNRVRWGQFALAIIDLTMPHVDGYSLIAALRASSSHTDLPIIVLTGKADREAHSLARSLGANECLLKPLSFAALRQHVAPYLECQSASTALQRA